MLERYREHLFYLEHGRARRPGERFGRAVELGNMSARTLTRHVAGYRRDKRVAVGNYSHYDKRRHEWIQVPNVYTITRTGILWINRHAKGLRIPRVI